MLTDDHAAPPAKGARLSTDCPARRVIEVEDPERYPPFDPFISQRGHDMQRTLVQRIWYPVTTVFEEVEVPWKHGTGHIDLVVPSVRADVTPPFEWPTLEGVWEIKSSVNRRTPSQEWVRQVQRYQFAAHVRGMDLPRQWWIVIVDPASYRLTQPFPVVMDANDKAALGEEFYRVNELLDRYYEDKLDVYLDPTGELAALCRCGQCFRPEPSAPDDHLEGLLEGIEDARHFAKEAKRELDSITQRVKEYLGEPGRYSTRTRFVTLSSRGGLTVRSRSTPAEKS